MPGDPPILGLMAALKGAILDGLMRYTAKTGRLANAREITVTLLALAHTTSKKDPGMPFAKALAMLMVEACKLDRELAHAAIDDAFDDDARRKVKKSLPKKPAA